MKASRTRSRRVTAILCVPVIIIGLFPRPARGNEFWNCAKDYTQWVVNLVPAAMEALLDAKDVLDVAKQGLEVARNRLLLAGGGATGATAAAVTKAAGVVAAADTAVGLAITGVEVAVALSAAALVGTGIGQGADYLISHVWDPICPVTVGDDQYNYPNQGEVDFWVEELLSAGLPAPLTRADFDRADAILPGSGTASWQFMSAGARCFGIATRGAGLFTAGKCADVKQAGNDLQAAIGEYITAINDFAPYLASASTFSGNPAGAVQTAIADLDALGATLTDLPGGCQPPCDREALQDAVVEIRMELQGVLNALTSIGDGAGNSIPLDGGYFPVTHRDDFLHWLTVCETEGVTCLPQIEIDITDRFVDLLGATYDGVPSFAEEIARWDGLGDTGNEAALFGPDEILYGWEVLTTAIDNHWVRVDISESPLMLNCGTTGNFIRGDTNSDGVVDISDSISTLGYLFLGAPLTLSCLKSADADDSGEVDISDAIAVLNFLFLGSAPPPQPFPACGSDTVPDALTCGSFPPCS